MRHKGHLCHNDIVGSVLNGMLMIVGIQVEPQEKKKTPKGRAKKRITYTRRFVNVTLTGGKRKVSSLSSTSINFAATDNFSDEPQPNHIDNQQQWLGESL